jgi:aminopeptidase YwaD
MKRLLTFLLFVFPGILNAQEIPAARLSISTLTSPKLWGRGYTRDGMQKAGDYISSEFKKAGLQPMAGKDFRQQFSYPVNTFPGKMEVIINGQKLIPGKDFIIGPASLGQKNKKVHPVQTDSVTFIAKDQRLVVSLENKLTWSVAQKTDDYTLLQINKKSLESIPGTIDLNIENTFIPQFTASNICGVVKGTRVPDSLLLITAHYDHLGGMGSHTFFPGANDNASGISLLLSLVKYYTANPPPYSIGFICFAGEEAGLLGSAYFTDNPLIPLNKIKFLINVDMVGTGEKGITVVNATLHPKEFDRLKLLNDQHKYLPAINSRGKAANSDHYYFTEKGVPAFFIYTQGGIAAYHDIYDLPATLPLTEFSDLCHLFVDFNAQLMQ